MSAGLTAQYTRRFGPSVPQRFAPWMRFAVEQKSNPFSQRLEAAQGREAVTLQVVNDAINSLDQMTQQNAALVEQSAAAAESLRDQASKLTAVVARFRLAPA